MFEPEAASTLSRPRGRGIAAIALLAVVSLVVLAPVLFGPAAGAQTDDDTVPVPPGPSVRVVTIELAPFVIADDGRPDGFYAEIWDETAARLDVEYEVVWTDSFAEMLAELEAGRADVAVAPLSPTAEREARFDFTSAVIGSGPQLGYHQRIEGTTTMLRAVLSLQVLRILLVALVGLVILAHVIWYAERDAEGGHFRRDYVHGIWDGFWWAAVTVTTVGYGDKAPQSTRGRVVALVGMLLSLFLVGAFVSQVTSILQGSRASAPFVDLDGVGDRPVGVVAGSSFATFVERKGVEVVAFDSQAEVFAAAEDGRVDVVVANPFALDALGPRHGVTATGDLLYEEFETFGVAQGSLWREPINSVLADMQAEGEIAEIVERWQS